MVGPLVYAASEDAVAAAKVLHQFAKKDDKIIVKAGSYNGEVMNPAQVAELGFYSKSRRAVVQTVVRYASSCIRLCTWFGCFGREKSWRRSRLIDFVSFNQLFLIQYLEYK